MSSLPKALIFGAGGVGEFLLPIVQANYQVAAFLDNDKAKQGKNLKGLPIFAPEKLGQIEYDTIVIASTAGVNSAVEQLIGLGVSRKNISTEHVDLTVKSRIAFLDKLGEIFNEKQIGGCVAEGGVFLGEFAREINRVFPTKKLYLFDTFSGFDERDIAVEYERRFSHSNAGHFNITSEEIVLSKLPHPELCVIRKGYFPQTAEGLEESFCFVNLDFDLYQPILAGLKYFYPRMAEGGVILVHDYFSVGFKGVKEAVDEFISQTNGVRLLPVGDGLSVAII